MTSSDDVFGLHAPVLGYFFSETHPQPRSGPIWVPKWTHYSQTNHHI